MMAESGGFDEDKVENDEDHWWLNKDDSTKFF